jgi:IS30 family transposase
MSRKHYCDNKHLTLNDRRIIETGIEKDATKVAIAKTIGKDPSTVAKEIRKHRILYQRNIQRYSVDCKYLKQCRIGCQTKCEKYEKLSCRRRDRSPGACNGCPVKFSCHIDKYYYRAEKADKEYHYDLVDSREGINLTTSQRDRLSEIIDPLIFQGQSPYQILLAHPEIKLCESTLYNYIDAGIFKAKNSDLKEKVKRKAFKGKYKPRKEPVCYEGRRYSDFLNFRENNPDIFHFEMDTVFNSPSGPFIQTLMLNAGIMIGFMHNHRTSESMATTFDFLQLILPAKDFTCLFGLALTDRGPEFQKFDLFEINTATGEARMNIFYCDPMASHQKPHVENNHNFLRDIIPNGISLENITNENLNLVFSHINCTPRESLNGKSPFDIFCFIFSTPEDPFYGRRLLGSLGIVEIPSDQIVLKPYLLKL